MDNKILFRDKNIIVCIKPVGVDSEGEGMPALLGQETMTGEVYCVHRLDKAVGGLMVYALTRTAAAKLSTAITGDKMEKEYLAVISGAPEMSEGTMSDFLFHDKVRNKTYVVSRERKGVKKADLDYKVLSICDGMSLIHIKLHTGRSHQIRVQFASRKMPLIGDVKYGSPVRSCPIALFSNRLSFPHPVTGERMTFETMPGNVWPWGIFEV